MIPPSFSDLGRAAKDLFDKKFSVGRINFDCYTNKGSKTVSFDATYNKKSKGLLGNFETKHFIVPGFSITHKWSTKNVLTTEISKMSQSILGLTNTGTFAFEPDTGKKSFKSKHSYKRDNLNLNADMFFDSYKPDVNVNLVLGSNYWRTYLAGIDLNIDTSTQTLNHHTFAIKYKHRNFDILTTVRNFSLFNTFIYEKISNRAEIGVNIVYDTFFNRSKFAVAGKYKLTNSNNSFVKAKIDQDNLIGLAYGCDINDRLELTLSAEIDGKRLGRGSHRFGAGISYEL